MDSGKFMNFLNEKLVPLSSKIQDQKHLKAISRGFMAIVPLTLIGGISLIIGTPPFDASTLGNGFFDNLLRAWSDWASAYSSIILLPYNLTQGLMSIFAVLVIAYNLAKEYNMEVIGPIFASLIGFVMLSCPPVSLETGTYLSMSYMGATGLFTAVIIAVVTVEIFRFLINKNIKITLPSSVPPFVTSAFEAVIPLSVCTLLYLALSIFISETCDVLLPQIILDLFAPIVSASDTWIALLVIVFLNNALWFFGIHGTTVIQSVIYPFLMANVAANAEAFAAGQAIPYTNADFFFLIYSFGTGAGIGLLFAIFAKAKSKQLRSVAKLSLIPMAFNVYEPMIFGAPMVLNLMLMVPFFVAPLLNISIAYFAANFGLISKIFIPGLPQTCPCILAVFLQTYDIRNVICVILLAVLDTLIYIPFVKAYDKTIYDKEQAEEQAEVREA